MKYFVLIIGIVVAVSSCNPVPNENYIDPQLADYYWDFQYEAARLNVILPDKYVKMHLQPAVDMPGRNGYCRWDKNSMIITINERYYKNCKDLGDDLSIEFTVFHELGHGYWGRRHTSETFDSTWWVPTMGILVDGEFVPRDSIKKDVKIPTSMMYVGDNKRTAKYFYKYLREYYIKELFGII